MPKKGRMHRLLKIILVLAVAAGWGGGIGRAQLYVAYANAGVVSEYDAETGAVLSETFILGLNKPMRMVLGNGALYILQEGSHSVGKFDAKTGAAINASFISDLEYPQTLAVDGDALFVACGEAQTQKVRIHKYDANSGALVKRDFVPAFLPPIEMAASNGHFFVGSPQDIRGIREFDGGTGAVIEARLKFLLPDPSHLLVSNNLLFVTNGVYSSGSVLFKFNLDDPPPPDGLAAFNILNRDLKGGSWLAYSGDDLFVGGRNDTAVAKYNAATGALVKAAFVPPLGDRIGGIAVVPRAPSGQFAMAEMKSNLRREFWQYAFLSMNYGGYFLAGFVAFVLLVLGWLGLVFFGPRRPVLAPVERVVAEMPSPAEAPAPAEAMPVEESPPPTPQAYSTSVLVKIGVVIMVITLVPALVAGYIGYEWYEMQAEGGAIRAEMKNMIGVWTYDNNDTRMPAERPVFWQVTIYPHRLEYSSGSGSHAKEGEWRNGGFWCAASGGSGDVEAVKMLDEENVELHMSTLDPGNETVLKLYKTMGSEAEAQAIKARYPEPIRYPPPDGVIRVGMTEYQLRSLPWKIEEVETVGQARYERGTDCIYHSDDPHIEKLHVLLKNHRVTAVRNSNDQPFGQ